MNTSTLNRSVLAVVIGTALAAGAVAPAHAQAWRQRQPAQEQSTSSTQDSSDSREQHRKEREAAAKKEREDAESARLEASRQREQAQVQQRDQMQREQMQQQREQMQQQREQSQQQRAYSDQREQNRESRGRDEQAGGDRDRYDREQAQAQREQAQAEREQAREQRERPDRQGDREADRQQREDRRDQQADARQDRQTDRQEQRDQRQSDRAGREDQRHADLPPPRRLENRQRDQRIVHERQQAQSFQQEIQTRIAPQAKYYADTLNHQHRSHGYHYQQQYYWRLLQMLAAWNWSSYNYYNDPYFYTADDYRYYRGGSWYSINRYGADILRQAVNYGYQEGFYAGRADQMDGWRFDYRGAWVYRDANYGYRGFYVSQGEYNYYFREGFRRGYEDGYYARYRYGRNYNGSEVILGTVLSGILNLQAYRW